MALSGVSGSTPKEFLQISFATGISRITITGDAKGSSFTLDDANATFLQVPTMTSISAPAVTYNADGTVTVTVTSPAGTPGGTISLTVDGGTPLSEPLSNGSATFTITGLNAGDHNLSASYATHGDFAGGSAT